MKTIHAVYENGIFRPTSPVDLPEGTEVRIEPTPNPSGEPRRDRLSAIYEILSQSHDTGDADLAERHNEHQP